MKKIILIVFIFLGVAVLGHELWMQPDKFIYKRGEVVNLKFFAGDNFMGANWAGNKDSVQNMQLFFDEVRDTSLRRDLSGTQGDSLQLVMLDEGTIVIAMTTNNSFIEFAPADFNSYLRENGLTEAMDHRIQNNDTARPGREYYLRCAKTILQVGKSYTGAFKKKTGMMLDIIPDDNPYNVPKDGSFKVKVLFAGEPLRKQKIKVWHKLDEKISAIDYTTDDDGEVKFFLSPEGEWMISCIKMVEIRDDPSADWQSFHGSLTWGYY